MGIEASTPKAKRNPWLQFHLSTAIVLMFVAAGLLWLNLRTRGIGGHGYTYLAERPFPPRLCLTTHLALGWPCSAWSLVTIWRLDPHTDEVAQEMAHAEQRFWAGFRTDWRNPDTWRWSFTGLSVNLVTALAILAAVAFVCEWLIRRKTRHP